MKRYVPFLLFAIFVFACTVGPLVPVPTQTPEPTQTNSATPPPTATPVLPTLTFTLTPTLIGYKTPTFTPENTATPVNTNTPFTPVSPTTISTLAPPVYMGNFVMVTTSLPEIFKAKGCEPSVVRITAVVQNPGAVAYVLLFARFKSLKAERAGKWTKLDMLGIGAGTFIYDLSSDQMRDDAYFETSWIEYQVVSTNRAGSELGRTDIFKERLKMLQCIPQPTETSANVKP